MLQVGKRIRENRKLILLIAAIVFLLAGLIVMLSQYNKQMEEQIFTERSSNIVNVTSKSADTLKLFINDSFGSLDAVGEVLSAVDDLTLSSKSELADYLQNVCSLKRAGGNRDIIAFVDNDTKYHMSVNGVYRTGTWNNFDILNLADQGEAILSETLPTMGTQSYLIMARKFDTLVTSPGGIVADIRYIMVCINTDDLGVCFDVEHFEKQHFYYVLDSDGHRMFRFLQGTSAIDSFNVFSTLETCEIIRGADADEIRESVRTGRASVSEMLYQDTDYLISNMPIPINNWTLLMFVPAQILNTRATSYLRLNNMFLWHLAGIISLIFACIIVLIMIIIDKQRAAELHRAANERLQYANELEKRANEAKTSFLFNMSHDIRTPMNAIVGFTNMALKNIANPDKVRDSLKKTQQASDFLLSLINDILEMSRIESGKIQLSEDPLDIAQVMAGIKPVTDELAKGKSLDLLYETGEIHNRYVYADTVRLERILVNIVTNAVKYTPEGGNIRVITCEKPSSRENWGLYEFTVRDNGIGMSEEFQKHLFETFAREENSTVSKIQGTGLGLALCKSLTDMMGGTIVCTSKKGEGSTFVITVPLKLRPVEEMPEDTVELTEEDNTWMEGKRCLLVEDNELNREIGMDILLEYGLIVEEAEDGRVAVDRVRQVGAKHFDFILMDIQMPYMDGYEATRRIREMYPDAGVPIIAVSANAFAEDKKKSLEAGMDAHIAKPINLDELRRTLYTLIKKPK